MCVYICVCMPACMRDTTKIRQVCRPAYLSTPPTHLHEPMCLCVPAGVLLVELK